MITLLGTLAVLGAATPQAVATTAPSPKSPLEAALDDLGPERAAQLEACGVDAERLGTLLTLDQRAFDQDVSGGWRTVAARGGCDAATADLIEVWRDRSPHAQRPSILNWHAGQMRAYAGDYEAAIALFDAARTDQAEWNLYADATIAFLRRDRAALEAARGALAGMAPSEAIMEARREFAADYPALTLPEGFVERPQNLNIVDRLLACFEGSYQGAYSGRCDAPMELATPPEACAFLRQRLQDARTAPPVRIALAVSPDWAASPAPRAELADLLAQAGRGEDGAAFGFAHDAAFAEAAAALTDADLERIAEAWSKSGPIDCPELDLGADPFTDDTAGFHAWAEAQARDPGPDAPRGAATLALSRPVLFDDGRRLIVLEQSSYTPIPLSRPPSALAAVVIYVRDEDAWAQAASLVLARGG
ncbi:MAG: hypothetical protein ACFE0P_08205 [Oceanicaulis sp.]